MVEPLTFDAWYRREHPVLAGAMLLVCGNRVDAAEAADEAFSRALERWDRVSTMASPTGWTYRVAVNVAKRRHRRRALEARLLHRQPRADDVEGPAGEAWLLVGSLPLRQRTAVVLRHLGQLTEVEIADVMGIGRSTVSSTLRAAHAALARQLAPDLEEQHG
jgi:RNA polymerase sigma-70 factor (ECF subfamily)